jgi:Amt family ammonium transporter
VRNKRALRIISGLGGTVALIAIMPSIAFAQDGPDTQAILDNIWVFIAGCLVFFMQAGFALVEAGLTRAKNVVNIFAKNLSDAVVGIRRCLGPDRVRTVRRRGWMLVA